MMNLKNKKKVFKVGINDIEDGSKNISYFYWKHMLRRCYDDKLLIKYPTYIGCSVCEEWKYYSNFKKWYEENYYEIDDEKMCLDKDILHKGNKLYSSDTCVFAPNRINTLFVKNNSHRGNLPIGVSYHKQNDKYQVVFKISKEKLKYLGCYNDPIEAFNIYKYEKEKLVKQVADQYKDKIPNKLYNAMYNYIVEITD